MDDEEKSVNADLLRKMMMGGYSSSSGTSKHSKKSNSDKLNTELDLHFNKLFPTKNHIPHKDKLELQIQAVEGYIKEAQAIGKKSGKIIVGKGEGVLKEKVIAFLKMKKFKYSHLYDPPYFGNALKVYF